MKYKGYDSEQFRQVLANIKEEQVSGGGYIVHNGSVMSAVDYFNSIDMNELSTLIRLSYSIDFGEVQSRNIIFLQNGELSSKELQNIPELKDLANFMTEANELPNIGFNVPVLSEIISGLMIVFSVIGIFTNEPRTKSFEMKNELDKVYNARKNYVNMPAGSMERNTTRVSGIAVRRLMDLRPKCVSNTNNCALEHLRYAVRGTLMIESSKTLLTLSGEYFNDANFKKFIDDYQLITASMLPTGVTTTKKPVTTKQTQTEPEKSGSIVPLVAGALGLFALSKMQGS